MRSLRSRVLEFWADGALLCLLLWIHREFYTFALLSAAFSHGFAAASPSSSVTAQGHPWFGTTLTQGCALAQIFAS